MSAATRAFTSSSRQSTFQSPPMANLMLGLCARALGISTAIAVSIASALAFF